MGQNDFKKIISFQKIIKIFGTLFLFLSISYRILHHGNFFSFLFFTKDNT